MTTLLSPLAHPERLSAAVHSVVQRAIHEQRLTGAVVAIACRGDIIYHLASGMADREAGAAMKTDTIFRLASVSKPIVSTAAMVLIARQQLTLDTDIRRWLPDFLPVLPDGREAIMTVRQLMSHTAGLGYRFFESDETSPYAQAGVSDGMDDSPISLEENLQRIARVPLLYPPGSSWGYSLATDVLGALVARVHGSTLAQAVEDLVTGPLDMTDTAFVATDASRVATAYVSDVPRPHRLNESERVPVVPGTSGIIFSPERIFNHNAWPSAGGGMAGTARDILRLLEALRQGDKRLLPIDLVAEMARDQTDGAELPEMPGVGFGLGFSVLRDPILAGSPESTGTWRWGGAYGHAWFVDPAQELSVVALTNTLYEGMSGQFVNALRDAVYAV
ncbi:serine hydrolase domain-containing protein [Pseudomonas graminis]